MGKKGEGGRGSRLPCVEEEQGGRGAEEMGAESSAATMAGLWSRGRDQEEDRESRLELLLACRECTAALHPCRASNSRGGSSFAPWRRRKGRSRGRCRGVVPWLVEGRKGAAVRGRRRHGGKVVAAEKMEGWE
jgi:hypothetical protein